MGATHLVRRVIVHPAGNILAGTRVDASTWANPYQLERMGFIRKLTPDELADDVAAAADVPDADEAEEMEPGPGQEPESEAEPDHDVGPGAVAARSKKKAKKASKKGK